MLIWKIHKDKNKIPMIISYSNKCEIEEKSQKFQKISYVLEILINFWFYFSRYIKLIWRPAIEALFQTGIFFLSWAFVSIYEKTSKPVRKNFK